MRIGDRARRSRRVSSHDIDLFIEISGDRNPLHYDQGLAAASRFGGIVVQGGVTSALLNAVVTSVREDKPVTTLTTKVLDQDGAVVLDGTAVVWRDPSIAAATAATSIPISPEEDR